jgi:nucleoside-diphosphate-sugar epimerase
MKILITGNMGYIGPNVVRQLRRSRPEAQLIGYDTAYFSSALTSVEPLPERELNAQYFGDVRAMPPSLLAGVDAVIHLAAISNDPMGKAFEEVTMDVNHKASVAIAHAAKKAGAKAFVFASSCSVYGFAEDGARTEDSSLNPLTAYARSKVAAEKGLKSLADTGFTVSCLRFATACGISPRLRLDLVLNDFVASALVLKRIDILSDGSPWRPLIDTKDMARAMDWAIDRPSAKGGKFLIVNVGSDPWNYQVKDLALAVQRALPGVEVSINKEAAPDKRSYKIDFSLFRELAPGHQPIHDLPGTVHELKAGLEAIGFADTRFRDSRLIRLKVLNNLKHTGNIGDDLYWK